MTNVITIRSPQYFEYFNYLFSTVLAREDRGKLKHFSHHTSRRPDINLFIV
jgi:hypothetical protein